jgi:Uma2 family endonuclease
MTPQPQPEKSLTRAELIAQLSDGAAITFPKVSWEEYEEISAQFIDPAGLRMSYYNGELTAMSLSFEHEKYSRFLEKLISILSFTRRINIVSFGSATMKKTWKRASKEPDACFYVQTAALIGNRIKLDFEVDPPPDIAVEVDIHHTTKNQLEIYAALGIPELWIFNGQRLTMHVLEQDHYLEVEASRALPMLPAEVLTDLLARLPQEGEFQLVLAFNEWLQSIQK